MLQWWGRGNTSIIYERFKDLGQSQLWKGNTFLHNWHISPLAQADIPIQIRDFRLRPSDAFRVKEWLFVSLAPLRSTMDLNHIQSLRGWRQYAPPKRSNWCIFLHDTVNQEQHHLRDQKMLQITAADPTGLYVLLCHTPTSWPQHIQRMVLRQQTWRDFPFSTLADWNWSPISIPPSGFRDKGMEVWSLSFTSI